MSPAIIYITVKQQDKNMSYTATTVTILRPSGEKETYDLSLGGGEATPEMEATLEQLTKYAAGELHTIREISEVQLFLSSAGYGLSNVILLEALPLHTVEL